MQSPERNPKRTKNASIMKLRTSKHLKTMIKLTNLLQKCWSCSNRSTNKFCQSKLILSYQLTSQNDRQFFFLNSINLDHSSEHSQTRKVKLNLFHCLASFLKHARQFWQNSNPWIQLKALLLSSSSFLVYFCLRTHNIFHSSSFVCIFVLALNLGIPQHCVVDCGQRLTILKCYC